MMATSSSQPDMPRPSGYAYDTWFRKTSVIVMTCLLLGMVVFGFTIQQYRESIRHDNLVNRDNGYRNRAVNCAILYDRGYVNVNVCEEPQVKQYIPPIRSAGG